MNEQEIREVIFDILNRRMASSEMTAETLNEQTSLIDLGIIDSFGFLELTSELEEKTGILMDFSDADPDEFTSVSGLLKLLKP